LRSCSTVDDDDLHRAQSDVPIHVDEAAPSVNSRAASRFEDSFAAAVQDGRKTARRQRTPGRKRARPPAFRPRRDERQHAAGHRILVVEDEPQLCKVVADYLVLEGFDVQTACDGQEALDRARLAAPELLLLDLDLPVLDGGGVLGVWAIDPTLKNIPVVLMSATPRLYQVARQYGVREALAKPLDMEALPACLERALRARDGSHLTAPAPSADT
jgi:CheY-like chemotaxis protein